MLRDTAKAIAHLKSRYPKNLALQSGKPKPKQKPRLPLKTAAPVADNNVNMESTLKVATRPSQRRNPQKPSNPNQKSNPKRKEQTLKIATFTKAKVATKKFKTNKNHKNVTPKKPTKPHKPEETNNFIFKGDALKRDVI